MHPAEFLHIRVSLYTLMSYALNHFPKRYHVKSDKIILKIPSSCCRQFDSKRCFIRYDECFIDN